MMDEPRCPDCGVAMRQTRRGATLARRGPAYVCPVSEREVKRAADGRLYREPGAKHTYVQVYQEGKEK